SYPTATGYWIDTVPGLQVFYNPGTPRDSAQVAQYGLHCFYWILENGVNFDGTPVCRDSSEAVCVHFYQRPVADAGEDDIACGYEYRLNAQSTGMFQGIWSSDYDDAYFHYNSQPNSTMPYDSVHVQVLSYDLNPNYYEFYWQEDSGWEIPNFECSDNDTVRIVFAARPGGVFFYNNPACHGSNATLWADLTDPAVDQNLSLFVWDFGNNVDSVIYGNGNPTGYGQHEVWWDIVNHPDDTMHSVWLQVTSEYGCMSYKHYDTVAEPQRMSPHIDVTPATCGLSNGTIELSTGNNTYTFTWVDDRIANPADTTVSGLTGGPPCYMLALTAQAEDQITYPGIYCYDTQSVYVPDTGYVTALFDTLPFVFQGTPPVADYDSVVPAVITLFDESSGDIEFWLWRFYNANGNLVSFIDEDSNTVSWTSSQYPTVTFMAQGVYTVRLIVESSFGCSDEFLWGPFYVIDGSFIYTVTGDEPGLLVFPNPCNDILNIESSRNTSEQATIEIFSESGRLLSAESNLMPADSRIGLDVSDLNEGVFFLRITSGRSVYVKRFVRLNAVK
ncbi:MAG: T9SS type A sorting domain-containing protein, partial [Bacteroidetes bacterium]|nr:T9SS type A sorting domain-containing protein [Bacteroidota bacterium]